MSDILLTMLHGLGVETRSFADSTGPLTDLRHLRTRQAVVWDGKGTWPYQQIWPRPLSSLQSFLSSIASRSGRCLRLPAEEPHAGQDRSFSRSHQ